MKIAIIGYSGSGKSTLAKRLADQIGVLPLYLDSVHFLPGWNEREPSEARSMVQQELAKPSWVIDGNYGYLLREQRLQEADEIIWLNYSRLHCLYRALKRSQVYKGKVRESAASGCFERMDAEFIWWILFRGRTQEKRREYRDVFLRYPEKAIEIKNDKALERFLLKRKNAQNRER